MKKINLILKDLINYDYFRAIFFISNYHFFVASLQMRISILLAISKFILCKNMNSLKSSFLNHYRILLFKHILQSPLKISQFTNTFTNINKIISYKIDFLTVSSYLYQKYKELYIL